MVFRRDENGKLPGKFLVRAKISTGCPLAAKHTKILKAEIVAIVGPVESFYDKHRSIIRQACFSRWKQSIASRLHREKFVGCEFGVFFRIEALDDMGRTAVRDFAELGRVAPGWWPFARRSGRLCPLSAAWPRADSREKQTGDAAESALSVAVRAVAADPPETWPASGVHQSDRRRCCWPACFRQAPDARPYSDSTPCIFSRCRTGTHRFYLASWLPGSSFSLIFARCAVRTTIW